LIFLKNYWNWNLSIKLKKKWFSENGESKWNTKTRTSRDRIKLDNCTSFFLFLCLQLYYYSLR
jgi:hypothetical protein